MVLTQAQYFRRTLAFRNSTSAIGNLNQKRVQKVLELSVKKTIELMKLNTKKPLLMSFYASKLKQLERLISVSNSEVSTAIKSDMKRVANRLGTQQTNLFDDYAHSRNIPFNANSFMQGTGEQAVKNVIGRVWADKFKYSGRVFRQGRVWQRGVKNILVEGIAIGDSAVNLSRKLKQYLVNPEIHAGVSWTTGIRKSTTGRGTIHYQALRLARTEINNTYREVRVISAKRSPIVAGIKWNLSAAHARTDICDIWAEQDAFGLGAGVYPSGAVPIEHPNGICFLTDELRPTKEWSRPKPQSNRRVTTENKTRNLIENKRGMTDGRTNAAIKMYESNAKLIEKSFSFKK